MTKCSVCGEDIPPGDEWPAPDAGTLCQSCWEEDCAEDFWHSNRADTDDDQADDETQKRGRA